MSVYFSVDIVVDSCLCGKMVSSSIDLSNYIQSDLSNNCLPKFRFLFQTNFSKNFRWDGFLFSPVNFGCDISS